MPPTIDTTLLSCEKYAGHSVMKSRQRPEEEIKGVSKRVVSQRSKPLRGGVKAATPPINMSSLEYLADKLASSHPLFAIFHSTLLFFSPLVKQLDISSIPC